MTKMMHENEVKAMDKIKIRKQIQEAGSELYDSIPDGPLKWLTGEVMALNEDRVINDSETFGAQMILMKGFTINQKKWIVDLRDMNKLLDEMVRYPTVHTMKPK